MLPQEPKMATKQCAAFFEVGDAKMQPFVTLEGISCMPLSTGPLKTSLTWLATESL